MKIEFKPGDEVTYFPYESAMEYVVITHKIGTFSNTDDSRVFYHLARKGMGDRVTTITTSKSIYESELFEPWDENELKEKGD